ncbi:MAG: biopolymer transport protein ExbD [Verrucomicrobiales bacterium]|jgi:biopolymer transport protein ExbD
MASAKLRNAQSGKLEDLKMDMSPMIDMVFLLLIFFMVASTIIIVPIDPKVQPPIATAAKKQSDARGRILVNIRPDGTVTGGGGEDQILALPGVGMGEVEAYIGLIKDENDTAPSRPESVLHVRADKGVEVKRIREVVEAGANSQVIKVVFAAFADPNKQYDPVD